MDKSEGGGKTSDPLPRRGELHRCGSHEARKASVRRKEVENHFFPFPGPVGSLPGGGRRDKRRRAGKEAVYAAPGGSVPKVLVLPLPVRVKAAEVCCMVCVGPGQLSEGKSAGQEASTGV